MKDLDPRGLPWPDVDVFGRGNSGIDYIHRFEGAAPGPHVMITAIVHGNEVTGAIGLDWLLRQGPEPARGTLSLGFMNVAAYKAIDYERPYDNRFVDEDFNRLWTAETLDGQRTSVELTRARDVRPYIDTVDHLLDLHSMSMSPDAVSMAGPLDKGRRLAERIGIPDTVIMDRGHAAGRRMRDYAAFGDPEHDNAAVLIETGHHFDPAGGVLAKHAIWRFLEIFEMTGGVAPPDEPCPGAAADQRVIEVSGPYTVKTDAFRYAAAYEGLEVIASKDEIIGYDGDEPVRPPYDDCVLVMPKRDPKAGETAVRFGRYRA